MFPAGASSPSRRPRCSPSRARRRGAVGLARRRRGLVEDVGLGGALVGADAHQVDADAELVERVLVVVVIAAEAAARSCRPGAGRPRRRATRCSTGAGRSDEPQATACLPLALKRSIAAAISRSVEKPVGFMSSRTTTRPVIFASAAAASSTATMSRSCTFWTASPRTWSSAVDRRMPLFCSPTVPSRRRTRAVLSAIAGVPAAHEAEDEEDDDNRKMRFRTTRRLVSSTRQTAEACAPRRSGEGP